MRETIKESWVRCRESDTNPIEGAIERNSEHVLSLLEDLNDLSQAETGRLDVARKKCDRDELLHDVDDASESSSGMGLGLTISRELVQALGGSLEVESEPDQGSIFRFDIEIGGQ